LPEVDLTLPKLSGKNIEEHFYNIAKQQVESFQNLIDSLLVAEIPKMPEVKK
jgi:DNA polymerase gamma 1